jgi:hypothetical protein
MRKIRSGISVAIALVALGSAVLFAAPAGAAVRHRTAALTVPPRPPLSAWSRFPLSQANFPSCAAFGPPPCVVTQAQVNASLWHVWSNTMVSDLVSTGPSRDIVSSDALAWNYWRNATTYTVAISVGIADPQIVGFAAPPPLVADAPIVVTAPRGCAAWQKDLRSNALGIVVARVWCSDRVSSGNIVLTDPRWPILVLTTAARCSGDPYCYTDLMVSGDFKATIS